MNAWEAALCLLVTAGFASYASVETAITQLQSVKQSSQLQLPMADNDLQIVRLPIVMASRGMNNFVGHCLPLVAASGKSLAICFALCSCKFTFLQLSLDAWL